MSYIDILRQMGYDIPGVTAGSDPLSQVNRSIGNYQSRLGAIGYQVPEATPKTNWFFKLLDVIDRPRNAVVSGINAATDGGNFLTGAKEGFTGQRHTYTSQLLEPYIHNNIARGVTGFLGDVALDPTTYMTFGLGSLAKGAVTGTAKNLALDAAKNAARDTVLDHLGQIAKPIGQQFGLEGVAHTGTNIADDLAHVITQMGKKPEALNAFKTALTEGGEHIQPFTKYLDTVKTEVKDGALHIDKESLNDAIGKYLKNVEDTYGETIAQQYNKTKGVGLEIPFTNKGVEFISGEAMQKAGAALHEAVSKIPGVGNIQGGADKLVGSIFNKYYMSSAPKAAKDYFRLKDIERSGMIDFANEQEFNYLRELTSKKMAQYVPELDNIMKVYQEDGEAAALKAVSDMKDSPFKDLMHSYGMFNGNPINRIDLNEYSRNVKQNLHTIVSGDELDEFMQRGVPAMLKGEDGKVKLRYFNPDIEDTTKAAVTEGAVKGKDMYIVSLDNVSSDMTGKIKRIQDNIAENPEFATEQRFIKPQDTVKVYKINPDGKTTDEILQDATGEVEDNIKLNTNPEDKITLKQGKGYVNYAGAKELLKEKDGNIFVPKMTASGRVDKNAYEVYRDGKMVDEIAATPEGVSKYGFKDVEDFNNAKAGAKFNLADLPDVFSEIAKGMDESKLQAATRILEDPEQLYSSTLTTEEKALRTVGVLLQDKLRDAGMQEKALQLLSTVYNEYVPHMVSWDKLLESGKVFQKGGLTKNLGNFNLNSLPREYKMSIAEANKVMAKLGYGENYFETNIAKAYLSRMIRHNKIVYDQKFTERLLNNIGYDVSTFERPKINEMIRSIGGDPKNYTLVIPKATVNIFSINNAERATLDAMVKFIDNGMEFSKSARNINTMDKGVKIAKSGIESIMGDLDRILTDNPQAGKVIEAMLGQESGQLEKIANGLKPLADISDDDMKVIQKLAEAVSHVPKHGLQKFQAVAGLRSTLQQLSDLSSGALAELDMSTYHTLAANVHGIKAYLIPTDVYKNIMNTSKGQLDEGTKMLTGMIDSFNRFWKTTVTSVMPSFHLRNWFGGQQQNMFEFGAKALNPRMQAIGAAIVAGKKGVVTLGGKEYTYDEIRKMMGKYRVETPFMKTEAGDLNKRFYNDFQKSMEGKAAQELLPWNVGRRVGNAVEGHVRAVNFMTWLDMKIDPMVAAERTKAAHFDYTELSNIERNVFKRVMPFYTFFRKNFPYQLKQLLDKPGSYTTIEHGIQNAAQANNFDTENVPNWLSGAMAMPLYKGENGRDYYLNASLPASDVQGRGLRELAAGLNPMIATAYELLSNRSILNNQPIERYPGQTTNVAGLDVNNQLLNALNKVGVIRNMGQVANDVSSGDEAKMLTSNFAYNPATMFGLVRGYNPDSGELNTAYGYQRELADTVQMLKDRGVAVPDVSQIDNPYIKLRGVQSYNESIKSRSLGY